MSTHGHEFRMPELLHDLVYGSYLGVVSQLHGLDRDTRDISVSRELFDMLGTTFDSWPRATVTGSKGKGSTSILLASILGASGETVGLITSPHLRRFNERIRIDGRCVSDEELGDAAHEIASAVNALRTALVSPRYLGPGGVILALAERIFKKRNVTAVVIEAGRGGEFDETRLCKADVSVITPIMLEHPDKLGASVIDIAATKTRITAPGKTIVLAPQTQAADATVRAIASELSASICSVTREAIITDVHGELSGVRCDITTANENYNDLHIGLAGEHQAQNAATAILAAQSLSVVGARCSETGVRLGLHRVSWPGRGQIIQQAPWVFLDAAINAESASHASNVVRLLGARHIVAVIGVPKPKDLEGVCRELSQITNTAVITEVQTPTLAWYENADGIASRYLRNVTYIPEFSDAVRYALSQCAPDDGLILVGTQSFVGGVLRLWNVDTCAIW